MEESLTGDFAFVKCWKADRDGNLVFHRTARNFNPDVATSGKIVIAEVSNREHSLSEVVLISDSPKESLIHIKSSNLNIF